MDLNEAKGIFTQVYGDIKIIKSIEISLGNKIIETKNGKLIRLGNQVLEIYEIRSCSINPINYLKDTNIKGKVTFTFNIGTSILIRIIGEGGEDKLKLLDIISVIVTISINSRAKVLLLSDETEDIWQVPIEYPDILVFS